MNDALIAELRQKFPADKPKMLAYLPGDRPIGSPSNLSYLIERVIKALETIPSASERSLEEMNAARNDAIDAARYRYLRKYGWDLITLPPSNKHREELAVSAEHLDELCDLGRK